MKKNNPFMLQDKSTRLLIISIFFTFLTSIVSFLIGLFFVVLNHGVFPVTCIIISLGGVIAVSGGLFILCITQIYSKSKNEETEMKKNDFTVN